MSVMQDWHPVSDQKKPGFLGYMQLDHDIAVTSIQGIISLHYRCFWPCTRLFLPFVTESMLFTLTESFRSVIVGVYEKEA